MTMMSSSSSSSSSGDVSVAMNHTSSSFTRRVSMLAVICVMVLASNFLFYLNWKKLDDSPEFRGGRVQRVQLKTTTIADYDYDDDDDDDPSASSSSSYSSSSLRRHRRRRQRRCVSLGDDGGLDRMIARYDLVYVVFPAKAAGSTMKVFTNECLNRNKTTPTMMMDNVLNVPDGLLRSVTESEYLKTPPIISSHLYGSEAFVDVTKHAVTNSLIIYLHREETDRFIAAISHEVKAAVKTEKKKTTTSTTTSTSTTTTAESSSFVVVSEDDVYFVAKNRMFETGIGATRILTCDSYESIEDNAPNLVFLHYKRTDDLLRLLSKHHCPDYVPTIKRQNVNSEKRKIRVRLKNNNNNDNNSTTTTNTNTNTVDLEEWLDAKSNLLEHAFRHKKTEGSCQAKTRRMQHDLFSCPDEALHYSSADFFEFDFEEEEEEEEEEPVR